MKTMTKTKATGATIEHVPCPNCGEADAIRIRSLAEIRLADEYDAAQGRGEVAGHGGDKVSNVARHNVAPTAADLGIRRDEIHEARKLRDAERESPGQVDRALNAMIRPPAPEDGPGGHLKLQKLRGLRTCAPLIWTKFP